MVRILAASFVSIAVLGVPAVARCQSADTSASADVTGLGLSGDGMDGDHPGFADIVRSLGADFRRAVAEDSLTMLGFGATTAWSLRGLDNRAARGTWGDDRVFHPGNVVGSALAQGGGAFATYLVGRVIDKPEVSRLGADLVRAQIVSQSFTQAIKFSATRRRPDGTSLSFPSGHTSSAFATATVLQSHYGWKAGAPAYAVAAWIGTSRVQMKRHYISDVITGAAIGIVAGRSVTIGRGRARFAVVPTAEPGGVGVSFVKVGSK